MPVWLASIDVDGGDGRVSLQAIFAILILLEADSVAHSDQVEALGHVVKPLLFVPFAVVWRLYVVPSRRSWNGHTHLARSDDDIDAAEVILVL